VHAQPFQTTPAQHPCAGRLDGSGPTTTADDFSSCWHALPSGIRQRLEPMLVPRSGTGSDRLAARTDARMSAGRCA